MVIQLKNRLSNRSRAESNLILHLIKNRGKMKPFDQSLSFNILHFHVTLIPKGPMTVWYRHWNNPKVDRLRGKTRDRLSDNLSNNLYRVR